MPPVLPPRPDLPLSSIMVYSFFAFFIVLLMTPYFVAFLRRYKIGKQLRVQAVDGSEAGVFLQLHQSKAGTPTMGGILIWSAIVITIGFSRMLSLFGTIDFSLLQRGQVYLPLFGLLSLGILGAVDDILNVSFTGKKRGLGAWPKLITLLLIGSVAAWWFYVKIGYDSIDMPFGEYLGLQDGQLHMGPLYIFFFLFVFAATANAVNFTDGLDGLAGGLLIVSYSAFGIIAYTNGLNVLAGFCGVTAGALAAFLWHNVPPALFFMGDTGSLALGGTLAIIAFMIDEVLILPLVGFVFVIEMLSVIIQLASKKLRGGKKVFLSAPIHHHFEALGWGESKVTMRLWIVGMFMAFLGVIISLYG